ncbi:MAG: hypothetical protein BMS9Abin29_2385 [Gemmatimonadota bacterium]|nr:MAG: hypothetical protein BMS9Abin29_2385 [Gemmatimonadota bacterium]
MGIGGLGMGEMVLIFLVVLLLFGAKRLPEIGSSLGKGIREFKSSVKDIEREIHVPDDSRGSISSKTPARDDEDGEPRSLTSSS